MTLLRKYNAVQSGKALLSADYILDTAVPQNTGDTKINKVGHLEVMVHQGTRHEETAVKEQKFREKDGRIKLPIFVYQKYHKQSDGIRANMGNTQNKYDLKKYFSV